MDIKVMGMFYFILCTSIDSMFAFNYTSAEAECSEKNGLASYRHFVGDTGRWADNAQNLKEGESAWILGYVKFSKFVAFYGCYSEGGYSFYKYKLEENSIYKCLKKCSGRNNIMYIGLRNEFCYCATSTEITYKFNSKPDNDCIKEILNSNLESGIYDSTMKTSISLYTIIDSKRLVQPVSEAQCVKTWSDNVTIRYKADSCDYRADGFICTRSAHHNPLRNECSSFNTRFCIVSKSKTWLMSFKDCLKYTGKLSEFVYDGMDRYLTANKSYWTGIFRTFKIENKSLFSNINVCLSVKKINDKTLFDPTDCSTEKKFICEEDISYKGESTSYKTSVDTKINSTTAISFIATTLVENTTMTSVTKLVSLETISPTQTKIEDGKPDLIGVYIAVTVVVAISLFIIIICVILLKRKRSKATSTTIRRSSKDQDNAITDNINDTSNADVAQRHGLAHHSVEEEVTYAKPDISFKKVSSSDSDYDRIRVKRPDEPNENTAKAKTIEDHVYGFHSAHPIDIDIEVYDHLEAARKTNVSKPKDGIYNTLAEDSDTYNVLRSGNREESTKSAVNRTQIKQTCPTYDKLK